MTDRRAVLTGRVRKLTSSRASAAVFAAFWQAAGSFVLQVIAAHLLGAKGLGVFALCLGVIVLMTAFTNGFVGDSLTVLDRGNRRVRAGLQAWTLTLALLGPGVAGAVLWASGTFGALEAGVFVVAASLFQVEEAARRLLMACLQFWRLVLVDGTAVLVAIGTVVVAHLWASISLGVFLGAVALGQLAGIVVAVCLLAPEERWLAPMRSASWRPVAAFGVWRGAQVAINPTVFTALRVLVLAVAGSAALGQVEAARIYVAPTILAIGGLSSYLFATYARQNTVPLARVVPKAVRSSLLIAGGVLLLGGVLWAAAPVAGPWITGGSFALPGLSVLGWALYAAAAASFMPLLNLAVARGRQRAALGVRSLDATISISSLALLLWAGMPYAASPFVLALGPFLAGLAIRVLIIGPMLRAESAESAESAERAEEAVIAPTTANPVAVPVMAASPREMVS